MAAPSIVVRTLEPWDAVRYRALRLEALRDAPQAFSSDYEQNLLLSVDEFARRIAANGDRFVLGAFDGDELVGVAGFARSDGIKLRHKAGVWGMYVTPRARRRGIARHLLESLLERACAIDGIEIVQLSVTAGNGPAERLYESLGFRAYGLERRAMKVDGRYLDEVHMALQIGAPD